MNGHGVVSGTTDNQDWVPVDEHFGTLAIRAGHTTGKESYYAITEPISLSSTFEIDVPYKNKGFEYARTGNPTRKILEERLAALEGGDYALCFSSGLSALTTAIAMLKTGDHIISVDGAYGGSMRIMTDAKQRCGITTHFVDLTDLAKFKAALTPQTKLVFLESPSNPTLKVIDIAQISKIAHGFSEDIIVMVDNTFLTCYFQKPLSLGVDVVHYSLTKYMNGHADVVMGALITSKTDTFEKLKHLQNNLGAVPSAFDCYLMLRGLKTLHIRMPVFMKNGLAIAKFLEKHPKIEKVVHPGLASHPQHELAKRQSSGHSGLIAFYVKGSSIQCVENMKIFQSAASLGGCESLVQLPYYFTHALVPEDLKKSLGITDNLVRISVGLESCMDLIDDLNQALNQC